MVITPPPKAPPDGHHTSQAHDSQDADG